MKNCEQTRAIFFFKIAHFSLAIVKSGPINSVREIVELELVVISCLKSVTPKVHHFLHTEKSRTNFANNGDVKSTKRFFFF